MNITTKLTSNEVIREINLMQHFDWTIDQKEERILVLEKALNIVKNVLTDISLDDFNSRLYFSGQQGTIEHYLEITKNNVIKDDNSKLIDDDFQPLINGKTDKSVPYSIRNFESTPVIELVKIPNYLYIAFGLFAVWALYLLASSILC